jgi:hypothetical protein
VQHITFLLDINTHDLLSIAITSSEQYFSYILGVVLFTTEHSPCFIYRSFPDLVSIIFRFILENILNIFVVFQPSIGQVCTLCMQIR